MAEEEKNDSGFSPWVHDPIDPNPSTDEQELNEFWLSKATEEVQEKREWKDKDIQAFRELVQGAIFQ